MVLGISIVMTKKRKSTTVKHLRSPRRNDRKKKRVVADYKLAGHIKKVGNTFKVFIKNLAQKENTLHWTTSYPHGYLQLTVKSREFDSY